MKEYPIIFSGPMVRAILDGRKTQTRRVIKPQPKGEFCRYGFHMPTQAIWTDLTVVSCPYGQPGDLLWVRETFAAAGDQSWVEYRADCDSKVIRWRPSIHMPRSASRLTLRITDVRVQRVQEISEEDARAEGTTGLAGAMTGFPYLWESINAKRGYGWNTNPWVWAISFERIMP